MTEQQLNIEKVDLHNLRIAAERHNVALTVVGASGSSADGIITVELTALYRSLDLFFCGIDYQKSREKARM